MKVCLIIAGKLEKLAGLEKHFIELVNGLSESIDVTVISHDTYSIHFLNKSINFIPLDLSKSRYNIFTYIKLYKLFKSNNFDIIHSQANKATFFASNLKSLFKNTKFIATIHNKKNKVSYFNNMDLVIGVSDFVSSQIKAETKTIYNGIKVEDFINSKEIDLKKELNIKNNFPIVTSIGRLVKAKGFDILIESIVNFNANLLIIGSGPLEGELIKLINKNNLQDRVYILGFRDDVANIIKSSQCIVISSLNEGFSYVFAETLCSEIPLLSTDVADIKKFIPTDFLIKEKNKDSINYSISYFFENKEKLSFESYYTLAKKKFSIKNMIDETKNEYTKIIRKEK